MEPYRSRRARLVGLVLGVVLVGTAGSTAREGESAPPAIPSAIQVDPRLEPQIVEMLRRSPTFRRQCRAIEDAPAVVVAVRLAPARVGSRPHATGSLRRYSSGLIVATVEVPAASPLTKLIAHEFEHVVEFLEGVDLPALAAANPSLAFRHPDGSFETSRAIGAGRAADAEARSR
jgi:hypothetical protein